MNSKSIIKLALSFLIPFIASLILIPNFFSLELTQNSVLALALFSFVIFLVVSGYRKVGHQGQFPIWIGIVLMFGSFIALAGSIGINGSEKLFELTARNQGFALIGLAIGGLFLFYGLKQMAGASYFLGSVRRR